ncbi:Protein of unknown function [Poseidonocella pacifica]|uniref:DUF2927 domain-containing protein n=1 Tax=Poseidonocella pacifica TaxID=871651 RepID=A0A1I0WFH4_9RHOB|nr:DUF2927 domain-containing protein [Poseidonocella pacifica]SFA87147.1 Protein of unknown function [Poseidonocella pacifica]
MRAGLSGRFLAVALFALAACETVAPPPPPTEPPARPTPPVSATPAEPSQASKDLATYYARVQNDLLTRGLLRKDGGGPDTPFNARQLAENFERIALYDEYGGGTGTLSGRTTASVLRRWEKPVRISVEFGATVSKDQRKSDTALISRYAARLARVTGHDIRMDAHAPNYHVIVAGEDDRPAFAARLREIVPGINPASVSTFVNLPRSVSCVVFAFPGRTDFSYVKAIALIRAEHPPQMRESCIHEELAQGLGLANDSPEARPSIFNDDEEFGLLTSHDELLLKMLYDPRLRMGMTAREARPIIETIAAELTGGPV